MHATAPAMPKLGMSQACSALTCAAPDRTLPGLAGRLIRARLENQADMPKGDDGAGSAANLGWYPPAGVALGLAAGYWVGGKFGWGIYGPLGGAVLGLIAGLYLLIKEGMRIGRK
jgi:hypothetical protein